MAVDEIVATAAKVATAAHGITSEAHGCFGRCVHLTIQITYIIAQFADVVSSTVEVASFSPDVQSEKELVTNIHNVWIVAVVLSWLIFVFEIFVITFSVRRWSESSFKKVIAKLFLAHTIVAIMIEDIMTTMASLTLLLSGLIPAHQFQNLTNQISVAATLIAIAFQYIWFFVRSCAYLMFRKKDVCCDKGCCGYFATSMLTTTALALAAIKSVFCFPILKSYLKFVPLLPLPPDSVLTAVNVTKSTYTVGDAIYSVSIYPLFVVQVTNVLWIVLLVARCTICKCLRRLTWSTGSSWSIVYVNCRDLHV